MDIVEVQAIDLRQAPGSADAAPDGYMWAVLNEVYPSLSSSPARVLMCTRCGALAGLTTVHDSWHKAQA